MNHSYCGKFCPFVQKKYGRSYKLHHKSYKGCTVAHNFFFLLAVTTTFVVQRCWEWKTRSEMGRKLPKGSLEVNFKESCCVPQLKNAFRCRSLTSFLRNSKSKVSWDVKNKWTRRKIWETCLAKASAWFLPTPPHRWRTSPTYEPPSFWIYPY